MLETILKELDFGGGDKLVTKTNVERDGGAKGKGRSV